MRDYKENTEIGYFLKHLFGLSYLSPEDVGDCFAIDFAAIQPESNNLTAFADYLIDHYIGEESTFPPHVWANKTASNHCTTNACESFHSKFNAFFYTAHPNIFQFLQILKDCQKDVYIKLNSVNLKKHLRRVVKEKKDFIEKKILEFESGRITRFQYVKAVSFKSLPINL